MKEYTNRNVGYVGFLRPMLCNAINSCKLFHIKFLYAHCFIHFTINSSSFLFGKKIKNNNK